MIPEVTVTLHLPPYALHHNLHHYHHHIGSTNARSRVSSSSRTVVPAGALTEHGWKSKPKFKDGVAARVVFDVDEHHDDDDPANAHHLEAQSRLGVWFVEA